LLCFQQDQVETHSFPYRLVDQLYHSYFFRYLLLKNWVILALLIGQFLVLVFVVITSYQECDKIALRFTLYLWKAMSRGIVPHTLRLGKLFPGAQAPTRVSAVLQRISLHWKKPDRAVSREWLLQWK